ncbi:hypothetical protein L7F22_015128 [Adiantum nelumboides]|nr:hypothetical protein [Adiantum nelumboides]
MALAICKSTAAAAPLWATMSALVLLLSSLSVPASAGDLVTYWGQNGNEGSLAQACQTGLYNTIMLSFLSVFGQDQQPQLNLAGHCDPAGGTCTGLSTDITTCQSSGVKVLLSIGGGAGSYGLSSASDAASVASYIWDNYLGGTSTSRPLGPAVLDGVDFDIELGDGASYYGSLAQSLRQFSSQVVLGAAPQCPFPDAHLGPNLSGSALDSGLFNYVWVQFYNNPSCQYGSDASGLLAAWQQWTSALPTARVLLGLPASTSAAGSGFLPSATLLSDVLPQIRDTSNYGGVMLYSYFYDETSGYGSAIKASV